MKKTIALLCGGISAERDVSLKSGEQVFQALNKAKYDVRRYDPQCDLPRLVADAGDIDAALIILHGPHGEDGTVQGLLELLDIPFQGTGVLGSAVCMNKLAAKQMYATSNIPVPPAVALKREDPVNGRALADQLGLPLVVKPIKGGSSIGMTIVRRQEGIAAAMAKAFEQDDTALMEAYIQGIEITGAVLGNDDPQALPLIEIIPDATHDFFDYEAKYTAGVTQEICPARISPALTEKAQRYARMAHEALFCKGYSRTDMIVRGEDIFVLETNTIPGMTPTSLFPQAAQAAGISFDRLLDRLIELGVEAHGRR
ncbi:MAG: D-alanine--D-alanine ligase [Desulfatitalea sp.]|nr:D-alanine--D-alanine ligase [Desulfatitalea sp.]NNK00544.1 D-alanine--D-alanine ligase [Desulfatitalea sp.]